MYKDTFGYFYSSELKKFLEITSEKNKFKTVLEIGSYEGIFSCYAAENFAQSVDTIDPFDCNDLGTSMTSETEKNCLYNIEICPEGNKITQHKMLSDEFFANNIKMFDFIYVDGSHEPEDAYRDLDNSLKFCKSGGIIWIDDYGSNYKNLNRKIEEWLNKNVNQIRVIHKNYQVGLIKK